MKYKIHIDNKVWRAWDHSLNISGYVYQPLFLCFYRRLRNSSVDIKNNDIDGAISELTARLTTIAVESQRRYDLDQEMKHKMRHANVNRTNNTILRWFGR